MYRTYLVSIVSLVTGGACLELGFEQVVVDARGSKGASAFECKVGSIHVQAPTLNLTERSSLCVLDTIPTILTAVYKL